MRLRILIRSLLGLLALLVCGVCLASESAVIIIYQPIITESEADPKGFKIDIQRSAEFYEKVFGWRIRQRGDGSIAFDDGVGEVSGTWVGGRRRRAPGLLIYIMVDSVAVTIEALIANGGDIVHPIGCGRPGITARFRDPAGNVIGLYQQPSG